MNLSVSPLIIYLRISNTHMPETSRILSRYQLEKYTPLQRGKTIVFEVPENELTSVIRLLKHTHALPLKTVAATDGRKEYGNFRIHYVFGIPEENVFLVPFITVDKYTQTFPSLTATDHEFGLYEQEIKSFFGLLPIGHPKADRIILHQENYPTNVYPLLKDFPWNTKVEIPEEKTYPVFQKYEGEGVYEIPVGPVHAGIIEPGHFRFSVLGEEILRLEPRLGYVHKGSEKLFENLSLEKKLKLAERISGDSSYHHVLAFTQALEQMSYTEVTERAKLLRVIYAELERLANHFNDIAFMMLDTGFSFGGSHGTRLRERILQWNEKLTGSRFFRGVVIPGGVTKDIDDVVLQKLEEDLEFIEKDFNEVIAAADESDSVLNRLKGTGTLDPLVAEDHGAVGIAARACGKKMDARFDYGYAAYPAIQFEIPTEDGGDVHARFQVRVREARESFRIVNQSGALLLHTKGEIVTPLKALPKKSYGIGIVEGWRGDIIYFVVTDDEGNITRVKVRDPSF